MLHHEDESSPESDSDFDASELTDKELQEAFSQGKLKPGLNVVLEGKKKPFNDASGLKQSLKDLKNELPWVERLDVTVDPVADTTGQNGQTDPNTSDINAEDDFQREMCFYRQAQAAVLYSLPRLRKLKVATKRPDDYFAEMAKTDQHMQKIRHKLQLKQASMEKSEKAKQLRALRKYGKKVQVEVLQKRQKEKSAMMTQIKKYQKGLSDKLDFLEGDQTLKKTQNKTGGSAAAQKAKNTQCHTSVYSFVPLVFFYFLFFMSPCSPSIPELFLYNTSHSIQVPCMLHPYCCILINGIRGKKARRVEDAGGWATPQMNGEWERNREETEVCCWRVGAADRTRPKSDRVWEGQRECDRNGGGAEEGERRRMSETRDVGGTEEGERC
ncbi:hypothetical protein XELAEV_18023040mg [Xenopus laevis]|uniref:rRNA-processing protein EBP2 n=1 Tax=Xenopus laevis TaxID=8355 RepID=A0A974D585_XENLA|nr:hypothetical protein XELAEV_18023040mg [Xenopus laevis]